MKIQVLGSGCMTCKKLYDLTKQAANEMGIDAEVEYITDIQKIIEMGVISGPILAIDGKPLMTGPSFDIERIKNIIRNWDVPDKLASPKDSGCKCGGNC